MDEHLLVIISQERSTFGGDGFKPDSGMVQERDLVLVHTVIRQSSGIPRRRVSALWDAVSLSLTRVNLFACFHSTSSSHHSSYTDGPSWGSRV